MDTCDPRSKNSKGEQLPHPQWRGDIDALMKSSLSLLKAAAPRMEKARPKEPVVCHGRVKDLGAMVPEQWWKTVFADAMYLKTDGDVIEDPEITKGEIVLLEAIPAIKNMFLRGSESASSEEDGQGGSDDETPSAAVSAATRAARQEQPARILDLCCGQGRHSLYLVKEYPHLFIHGHDQSSYLISLAQERASFQSVATQTTFTVGDCVQVPSPDKNFDLVLIMGNSFGYFSTDDGNKDVLAEVERVLAPGGYFILDLTDGDYMRENFAERSWEWVDDTTFTCRERQLSEDRLRLCSREIITIANKGVVRDQFYQERLYSREELHEMIRNAGLEIVDKTETASEGIITIGYDLSKRKEDLGMMGQRMMIVARKPAARSIDTHCDHKGTHACVDSGTLQSKPKDEAKAFQPHSVTAPLKHRVPRTVDELASGVDASVILDDSNPSLPFPDITIVLGDPSMSCIGKLNNMWNKEDLETRQRLVDALYSLGFTRNQVRVLDAHKNLILDLKPSIDNASNPCATHFVFNLCDEGFYNDALKELHVPALLEMTGVPYSGAGPNCLAYCYDKGLVNRAAEALGVPVARELIYLGETSTPAVGDLDSLHALIQDRIGYPAFIKPTKGDNSLGITSRSIVRSRDALKQYISELNTIGIRDVLVQEYLAGTEYGVGMIGNPESGFYFLPVLEVDYTKILEKGLPPILGFESKWDPTSPYWTDIAYKRARLSPRIEHKLRKYCIILWERFGCRDYARFDFRADKGLGDGLDADGLETPDKHGTIKLLEVNPNPGWCWDGKFAYMAKFAGIEYRDMLRMILNAARDRLQQK